MSPDTPDANAALENAFRGYGRSWRPENPSGARVSEGLRHTFRWVVKKQTRALGARGPVLCDVLDNEAFNALATVSDDYDCVAIFSGAVESIFDSVLAMTSDDEVVSAWGSPAVDLHTPADTLHRKFIREIGEMACLFILLHEVGHVVNCHPKFLEETYGMATLKEIPLGSDNNALSQICKAFEWEADEYAAVAGYQMFRLLHSTDVFGPLKQMHPDHAWSVCLCLTFAFIADASGGDMTSASATHPAPLHRYVWAMMSIESADNCRRFFPATEQLQRGYSDVFGWFKKHGAKFTSALEVGGALAQMKDAYSEARATLSDASSRLEQLGRRRRICGEEWLQKNPQWMNED